MSRLLLRRRHCLAERVHEAALIREQLRREGVIGLGHFRWRRQHVQRSRLGRGRRHRRLAAGDRFAPRLYGGDVSLLLGPQHLERLLLELVGLVGCHGRRFYPSPRKDRYTRTSASFCDGCRRGSIWIACSTLGGAEESVSSMNPSIV